MSYAFFPITLTADKTLTSAIHANGPILRLNALAGLTATLPCRYGNWRQVLLPGCRVGDFELVHRQGGKCDRLLCR
jgi:hypothetical protein